MNLDDARRGAWRPISTIEPIDACEFKLADGSIVQGRTFGRRTDAFVIFGEDHTDAEITHWRAV
jgi:hypothetical protein